MSVDEVWGLKEDRIPTWVQNRDSILESLKDKLCHSSPLQYLHDKYPTPECQEKYARVLWQVLPPLDSKPPFLDADVPSKSVDSVSPTDVHVAHLATMSLSEISMVCPPSMERVMKLADEILTDGFVTETEPLMLNASPKEIQQLQEGWAFFPPWGETVNGNRTLRPFSLCHHKSAARVITLRLIVNVFLEDPQQCF